MAATATSSSSHYHLDLPQKENVFVTQLIDGEDNEDIRRFPIVKESADSLLRSGINTLQSTALLRQALDVENVDRELAEKRKEFRERMEVCKAKEKDLQIRRQKVKDRVKKFDKFLRENEAKRNRALKQYQQQVQENKIKSKELAELNQELQMFRRQKIILILRLQKYKIFETYLTKVVNILPENYLEMTGDSMIQSILHRYEALSDTNQSLVRRNHAILTGLEEGQKELDDLRQEINNQKLLFSSELAFLQKRKEKYLEKNKILEQRVSSDHDKKRNLMGVLGQVVMGIDNLASQSHRRHWPPLTKMDYTEKLSMILEYVVERMGVEQMVRAMMQEAKSSPARPKSLVVTTSRGSSPDKSFPRKHVILPPIKQHSNTPTPSSGDKSTTCNQVATSLSVLQKFETGV